MPITYHSGLGGDTDAHARAYLDTLFKNCVPVTTSNPSTWTSHFGFKLSKHDNINPPIFALLLRLDTGILGDGKSKMDSATGAIHDKIKSCFT
eukprot:858569-Ditylum_brightwellii.AAC.2